MIASTASRQPFLCPFSCSLQNSVNRPILLTVYNTKTLNQRDVVLTPSNDWPGEGLLGIKIKLNTYESLHVDLLNVYGQVHKLHVMLTNTPFSNHHSVVLMI